MTTDVVGKFAESSAADVDAAVAATAAAGDAWRDRGAIDRAEILATAQRLLTERAEEIAAVITREQGKQIGESRKRGQADVSILDFTRGEARRLGGANFPLSAAILVQAFADAGVAGRSPEPGAR